ncbi:hypothetical protein BC826DRAFT_967901 [Russula brevipes]|nr:hypothetical protein BC826DRAFT_967901 [Russula brevipes]
MTMGRLEEQKRRVKYNLDDLKGDVSKTKGEELGLTLDAASGSVSNQATTRFWYRGGRWEQVQPLVLRSLTSALGVAPAPRGPMPTSGIKLKGEKGKVGEMATQMAQQVHMCYAYAGVRLGYQALVWRRDVQEDATARTFVGIPDIPHDPHTRHASPSVPFTALHSWLTGVPAHSTTLTLPPSLPNVSMIVKLPWGIAVALPAHTAPHTRALAHPGASYLFLYLMQTSAANEAV